MDNANTTFRDWISGETIDISAVTGFAVLDDATEGFILDVNSGDNPIAGFTFGSLGPSQTGIVFSGACQYMALLKSDVADALATLTAAQSSGSGDDALLSFQRLSNENWAVSIGVSTTNDTQQGGVSDYEVWTTMGCSRNNPSGGRTIIEGGAGSYDTTATGNPNNPAHDIFIMNDGGGSNAWDGQMGMLVIFDEELTSGENTDFDTNPWRIFLGGNIIIEVPLGPLR